MIENNVQELDKDQDELDKEMKVRRLEELREKQQEAKEDFKNLTAENTVMSTYVDEDGNEIAARQRGKITLKMLNIENDIIQVKRFRKTDDSVHGLQDSIRRHGLLQPIHVVPYGDVYILLQGYRRLQAYVNLGKDTILAVVDYTIPPELVKYFQVEMNNVERYRFIEQLDYGKFVEETQPQISVNVIEQSLGLNAGEYLKMKYIDQFKEEFPDIFLQVQNERLSIDQAYKKIDREIDKQQKELEKSETEDEELDKLKDVDELSELSLQVNQQELGKRKELEPVLRRSIESRAGGACQCCSYGKDVPDLMGVFQVHHIVPVKYGGDDSKGNLILLCHNCHKLVHDYETGRFMPERETYDRFDYIKRVVVLGNILRILRQEALRVLRTQHVEISRQVDKGVLTIGQGLLKAKKRIKWEEYFEGTPYTAFIDATKDLKYGGSVKGEFSDLDNFEEEDTEDQG